MLWRSYKSLSLPGIELLFLTHSVRILLIMWLQHNGTKNEQIHAAQYMNKANIHLFIPHCIHIKATDVLAARRVCSVIMNESSSCDSCDWRAKKTNIGKVSRGIMSINPKHYSSLKCRCVVWEKFNDYSEGRIVSISISYTQDGRSMFVRNVH
jgi:hypothetical protein